MKRFSVVLVLLGSAGCSDAEEPETSAASSEEEGTTETSETDTGTETGVAEDCVPNAGTPMINPDYGLCDAACAECREAPLTCGRVCVASCEGGMPCPAYPGFNPECVSFTQGGSACLLLCSDDEGCPGGMFCNAGHCFWPD